MEQTEDLKEREIPQEENVDLEDKTCSDGGPDTECDSNTIPQETNRVSKHNGEINDTEIMNHEKDEHLQDENQECETETDRQNQPLVTSETIVLESEKDNGHDKDSEDENEEPQDEPKAMDNEAEKSIHEETFKKDRLDDNTDGTGIEMTNGNAAEDISLEEVGDTQCSRLESSYSLTVNVGSLQRDDSDAEATCVEDGPNNTEESKEFSSELELGQENEIEDVEDIVKDDYQYQDEEDTRESREIYSQGATEDENKELSHESEQAPATGIKSEDNDDDIEDVEDDRSDVEDSNELCSQDVPQNESNEVSVELQLNKEDYNNEDDLENFEEDSQVEDDAKSSNTPNDNSEICHDMKYKGEANVEVDPEPDKEDDQPDEEEAEGETNAEVQDQRADSGDDESTKDAEVADHQDLIQIDELEDIPNQDESCRSSETEEAETEEECQDDITEDNSEESEESSKVKEIGKIFQRKDDAPVVSKESQAEKSPVSVRRYKEIFEHGELLLSPAAYNAVPDSEVSSPRPGIVKSMCDLFENPKNFEWPEGSKRPTAVN